ncbi:MAG: HDOD domain-containing protein [Desulfobacterales bacterium]
MAPSPRENQRLDAIVDAVNRSDLSTIRSVVLRLMAIINDPAATAKDLVETIQVDPPLAAKVLKLVNSAYCSPRSKISDLQQAVIFIGFETLKELALNQKVCEIFQKGIRIEGYSRKALWKHSVAVALFAKQIYRKEFGEMGDGAYAAGLLHDIGIIVEDQFLNEDFTQALQLVGRRNLPQWIAEKEILGFDHSEVGMALLSNWGLPEDLTTAIGRHHDPLDASHTLFRLSATIYLANHYCQRANMGFCDSANFGEELPERVRDQLHIEEHAIELIREDITEALSQLESQGII